MDEPAAFTLHSENLGALPLINHFLSRLRAVELLERYVPCNDARLAVAPSAALGVLDDAPGDFVRSVKQLVDLLRQLGEIVPPGALADHIEEAIGGLHRGIVAYSSL
jgi:hypothetical protein